jgi:hypothetical protein
LSPIVLRQVGKLVEDVRCGLESLRQRLRSNFPGSLKDSSAGSRLEILRGLSSSLTTLQTEIGRPLLEIERLIANLQAVPADDESPFAQADDVLIVVEIAGKRRLQLKGSSSTEFRRITCRGVVISINGCESTSLAWNAEKCRALVQFGSSEYTPFDDVPAGSEIRILALQQ